MKARGGLPPAHPSLHPSRPIYTTENEKLYIIRSYVRSRDSNNGPGKFHYTIADEAFKTVDAIYRLVTARGAESQQRQLLIDAI